MTPLFLVANGWLAFLFPSGPVPGLTRSVHWIRQHDCERLSKQEAYRRYPGRVPPPKAEEDGQVGVVVCSERVVRDGLRSPRDEAVLRKLDTLAEELVQASEPYHLGLDDRTWVVDVFYPDPSVSAKLSFATKDGLLKAGVRVSDRVPLLSAEDINVLTRMHPDAAYPAACQRYADTGALGADEVLLAVVQRDPRETVLHAGICVDGGWAWLK
mgnify:FL=1